jgi:sphingosine kinase
MSWNLNGTGDCSMAALCIVKGLRTPLDLCSVTQGERRTISFLSQSVGIVAESDLGTDNIRWMGDARFTFGVLVRLLGKTMYPCDIAVKTEIEDKSEIKKHYALQQAQRRKIQESDEHSILNLESSSESSPSPSPSASVKGLPTLKYGTVNSPLPSSKESGWTPLTPYTNLGNFYAGNMSIMTQDAPFFPASLPSDGMLDLVTIPGDIGRMSSLSLLLKLPKNTFFDAENVRVRKVVAYRIVPRFGKWADGEREKNPSRLARVLKVLGLNGGGGHGNRDGGYISIDGEKYPFEPFQVEVHQGLGTVLSRNVRTYEGPGPTGWEAFTPSQDEVEDGQS